MIKQGHYYLITTDNWFIAPDGEQYRSVWGKVNLERIEDTLGFTPVRPSTNWFAFIGSEQNHVVIAGCQIHYAVRCDSRPTIKPGMMKSDRGVDMVINSIYIAE